jgi:hypothetical protein
MLGFCTSVNQKFAIFCRSSSQLKLAFSAHRFSNNLSVKKFAVTLILPVSRGEQTGSKLRTIGFLGRCDAESESLVLPLDDRGTGGGPICVWLCMVKPVCLRLVANIQKS